MHFRMRTALAAGVTAAAMTMAACSGPGSGDDPSEEFTYWSMWKEGEPQQKVMAQAIEDFEAETGITVDVQWRSEEHTSELQSRFDLVCRLLLEKKKKNKNNNFMIA